ncbi:MAG: ATP-binding cassette domain-containing protein [Bacteroidales bacterium]|nr:ATP-binding cassette domain-containing protein [Bacteroidales bacterium]
MADNANMLQVEHVSKSYGDFYALRDVSLDVTTGRIFGLLGPNGAGKSTLIRIVNQILQADEGKIVFDGHPIRQSDVENIGYLPEERGLYKKMKVGDQAMYLAKLKGLSQSEAEKRLRWWFKHLEIDTWWNRKVEELSKGMQQKVQFVTTVLHNPKLLIFDEPFSGFDPVNATLLKKEILRLRDEGATVIFSTHNMSSVEEICDDIALINHAQVVLSGNVKEIRQSYRKNMYHVEARYSEDKRIALPPDFEVKNVNEDKGLYVADVSLPQAATSNDLLSALMSQGQVVALQEILPSMNDIFIEAVSQ